MCGEKVCKDFAPLAVWGSPPHVRGKVLVKFTAHDDLGITPACAGKRCAKILPPLQCGDHPRMCGEKTKKIP